MAVDEVRLRVRAKLEQLLGPEEASWLMDRPPGGWSDLVTNQVLDAKVDALRADVRSEMTELRSEMTELRTELRSEMTELRVEVRADLATTRAGIEAVVDRRLRAQAWIATTTLIAGIGLAFTAGQIG